MEIQNDLHSTILCSVQNGDSVAQLPLELLVENGEAFVVPEFNKGTPIKLRIDASLIRHVGDQIRPHTHTLAS